METFVSPLFRSKVVQTAVLQSDGGWVVGRGVWRVEGGVGGVEKGGRVLTKIPSS